jgi:RES domain-containing protein
LYRAAYGPGLDGIGGTFADGRWHTRGERVVYFGATAAIVVLERLAHTDPDLLPIDLRLACFECPERVASIKVDVSLLSENWVRDELATRRIGGQWWRGNASPLLLVPSAILPEESNYVLNAQHPDAKSLHLIRERPFIFDLRLI